jgi:hypothetical protein
MGLRLYRSIAAILLLSLASIPSASAAVYDLVTDWSDASNPNGVWTYGTPFSSVTRSSDPWGTPQPSWGDLPGWFKSNGTELFVHDWLAGDVVTHTGPSPISWTSPENALADISGFTWMGRDIGRSNTWTISLNSVPLTSGLLFSGDPFDRTSPMSFALGVGGLSVLQNIPVSVGDVIELRYDAVVVGDYSGASFTVTTAAIPEPSTYALLIAGLFVTAVAVRRRKPLTRFS